MPERENTLLVLGASRYYVRSIQKLKSYGYKVLTIDGNPDSPGFEHSDGYAPIDITDRKRAYDFALENAINGVIVINDFGIETAAYINEKLGLLGVTKDIADIVINKLSMRKAWDLSGAPNPKYMVTNNWIEAREWVAALNSPVIVKPVDSRGGGSRGVMQVENTAAIENAFTFAQSFYDNKDIIIEECVSGSEHSIEVVVIEGKSHVIAISEKVKTPYPYRVDKQVIYPADLDRKQLLEVYEAVDLAIKGVGVENGVAHIEMAVTENGPVLFEIGARPGGGATPVIVEETTGIEYLLLYCKVILGEKINPEELVAKKDRKAIYHFFTFTGQVEPIGTVCGLDCFNRFNEIVDYEIFLKGGDLVPEVKTGKDRHGFSVLIGDSMTDLKQISAELDKCVAPC